MSTKSDDAPPAPDDADFREAETAAISEGSMPSGGSSPKVLGLADAKLDAASDPTFGARYERRTTLGEGGMGEVIEYTDHRIGRRIAVKTIRTEAQDDSGALTRFLSEARLQGQLEHPSIAPVYDMGNDDRGRPFFTMKRVRGRTLQSVLGALRRGDPATLAQYSPRKLLSHFSAICQTVEYAHSRGVVHRDLKPSNIMLGSFGEVYLLDWGVAKALHLDEEDAQLVVQSGRVEMTSHGEFLGTAGYAAPEQLRGDEVDARADVYALGAVLFAIVALEPLHRGKSLEERCLSTLDGVDARPSVRAPDRDVPPELDAICSQATMLVARDRYESAAALNTELERFLDGDRNLALRVDLAAALASEAAERAERALSTERRDDDLAERREAMKTVGRALALDPANPVAGKTLIRLLTEVPSSMPAEVQAELEAESRTEISWIGRIAAVAYASMALYVPLLLWAGITDPTPILAIYAFVAASVVASVLAFKRPAPGAVLGALVASNIAMSMTSALFGALVLVPTMIVANTVAFAVHLPSRHRAIAVIAGFLAIVTPLALELLGVFEPTYSFEAGAMTIHSHALTLPELPTYALLGATSVAGVATGAFAIGRIRDALGDARARLRLQAWQMRVLFPSEAKPER